MDFSGLDSETLVSARNEPFHKTSKSLNDLHKELDRRNVRGSILRYLLGRGENCL